MPMRFWITGMFAAMMAVTAPRDACAITFFVAPNGNDNWNGRIAKPNAEKTDGPFATLKRARDAVRSEKAAGVPGPYTVEVRGGTYYLDEPLRFGPEDSGSPDAPVVFRAYAGEKPVISGGRRITGFRAGRINGVACRQAPFPQVRQGWYFHQLYTRRHGARHFERRFRPTTGMLTTAGLTYSPARKASPHRAAQQDFIFRPGDFRKWRNLDDIEVVALHSWSASRLYIEKLDFEHNVVRFTAMPTFRIGHWYGANRNPYWIENIREELKRPGQWYLDRSESVLYYVPLPGETPENLEFVAPRLECLVIVRGDPAERRFVEYLRFEGLAFCHAAWSPPRTGYDVSQGQPTLPAAVEWSWARHCVMERCTVAHTGAYAVCLGRGCSGNTIRGCLLYDLGGGGVKVGDSRMNRNAEPPELPENNTIANNVISDGGIENFSANAVWAGIVRGLTIRHNEIRNFPYTGIAVGWCWGYAKTSAADNRIEFNHIHHVMRLLQDGGGIYTLGQQPGSVIRGNVIHDCFKSPFACNVGQLGIYLDEGSGPFRIEQNLVYDVQMGGFNQHYGRGNLVRNNIFAFIRQDPITCGRGEKHLCYTFERNIVYLEGRDMLSTRYDPGRANTTFDYNLYFSTSGKPPLFGGRTFEQWTAAGFDRHSLIADPRFVDASRRNFRVKPDSPAFKLGITPPDAAAAGLNPEYQDVDDPSLPHPTPPVYAMKMPEIPLQKPGFRLDFEDIPCGVCPREFTCSGCIKGRGEFVVTDETAFKGKRCLRCIDDGNLPKPFYPYLIHRLPIDEAEKGRVEFSFAFRNDPQNPGDVRIEFRDYVHRGSREFISGPELHLGPDGTVDVGDEKTGRIPLGVWCEVRMNFRFGPGEPHVFEVQITTAKNTRYRRTSRVRNSAFITPTWLGIISAGTRPCRFYLDDIVLKVTLRK